jgi:type IV pilus assembly protein PilV
MRDVRPQKVQQGIILLEGLMAILIFSMGILAIVGLQVASIKHSAEAKYRADASLLANQIIGQMWVNQANIAAYAHNPAGGAVCNPAQAASGNADVANWLAEVAAALPGARGAMQQISVAANNQVTVTVCWQGPQDPQPHNFVVAAQINS